MILLKVATPNSFFLPCLSQQLFARSSYRVVCCSARPCKAIFTGVPMLLALDKPTYAPLVSSGDGPLRGRRQVMWEGIAQVWAVIASVIESSEPQELSHKVHTSLYALKFGTHQSTISSQALRSLPQSTVLPTISGARTTFLSRRSGRIRSLWAMRRILRLQDLRPLGPIMDPRWH